MKIVHQVTPKIGRNGKIVFSGIGLLFLLTLAGCYSPKVMTDENFSAAGVNMDSVIAQIPDYDASLSTVKGKGKAIVSEPENSHHVTLYFAGNRHKSLITIKNRLGIEGGKILSTRDSLTIYNRIDKYVQILPAEKGGVSQVDNLASVNLVEMLTLPVTLSNAEQIQQNNSMYLITMPTGAKVYIDKKNYRVRQIDQPATSGLPYSRIIYDAYDTIKGFSMPRRITILSADKSSKVSLLIQSLTLNPELGELTLDIPQNIPVYRQ